MFRYKHIFLIVVVVVFTTYADLLIFYYTTGHSLQDFMTFDLNGAKTLSIKAVMHGGKGEVAWQHTQLFRQSIQSKGEYPFEIRLFLD